jgi:hypothetical protein
MNEGYFLSNRFTYHHPTRTFVAEMSDLQICKPEKIHIISTKTGRVVHFNYVGKLQEIEQYDGELRGYEYDSSDGYKIHLYND